MHKEKVLVIDKETFLKSNYQNNNKWYIETTGWKYLQRKNAEVNENYVQLIPYILIMDNEKLAVFKRTNTSEERLADKYTIGIGGHINPKDGEINDKNIIDILTAAISREIEEETRFIGADIKSIEIKGTIYKPVTPVDKVHTGLLIIMKLRESGIEKTKNTEGEITFHDFVKPEKLLKSDLNLETWSIQAIKQLLGIEDPESKIFPWE